MLRKSHYSHVCLAAVVAIAAITSDAQAYVTPKMGGGQMSGSMKHADIYLNGVTRVVTVHLDDTVPTPVLRPLTPPDQFDPNQPWSILNYKAYNYQIAWNPGGISGLPDGSAIWGEAALPDSGPGGVSASADVCLFGGESQVDADFCDGRRMLEVVRAPCSTTLTPCAARS